MLYYIKQEEALTMTQTLEERFAQKWLANKFRLFRQRGGKLLKDFTMLTRRAVVY